MSQTPWTVRSLKAALDEAPGRGADEITVSVLDGADEILLATMHWHGDLEIYISVSDQQVAASALLWPVDEQEDRHAFNEFLLKAQKLVPLSNFGICAVGGRDYYELFGELSTTTTIEDILIELRTLAENAIEVASDLRTSFSSAA